MPHFNSFFVLFELWFFVFALPIQILCMLVHKSSKSCSSPLDTLSFWSKLDRSCAHTTGFRRCDLIQQREIVEAKIWSHGCFRSIDASYILACPPIAIPDFFLFLFDIA